MLGFPQFGPMHCHPIHGMACMGPPMGPHFGPFHPHMGPFPHPNGPQFGPFHPHMGPQFGPIHCHPIHGMACMFPPKGPIPAHIAPVTAHMGPLPAHLGPIPTHMGPHFPPGFGPHYPTGLLPIPTHMGPHFLPGVAPHFPPGFGPHYPTGLLPTPTHMGHLTPFGSGVPHLFTPPGGLLEERITEDIYKPRCPHCGLAVVSFPGRFHGPLGPNHHPCPLCGLQQAGLYNALHHGGFKVPQGHFPLGIGI